MFKLAELFVDIRARDDEMRRQVGTLKGELTVMGAALGTMIGSLATRAISSATAAITGFFSEGISGATHLAETMSKVQVVFGDSTSILTKQADDLSQKYGFTKQVLLDAASDFGEMAKGAGMAQPQMAAMAEQFVKLAADAKSYKDVPIDVAIQKLSAGLAGESEPLRRWGVTIDEDSVKAEAMRMGLVKAEKDIDLHAKTMARASLITKGLANASGDLERTADSTANKWTKFTGGIQNAAISLGEQFAPAINAVVTGLAGMGANLTAFIDANKATIKDWSDNIVGTVKVVGVIFRNLPDIWEIIQIKFREMATNLVGWLAVIPDNAKIIGEWFGRNWVNLIKDAFNAATEILTNFGNNIYALGESIKDWMSGKGWSFNPTPLLKDFKAMTEKLPEIARPALVDLQAEIDAVGARMADRESKLADQAKATVAAPVKAAAAAAGKAPKAFQSEVASGEDAYFAPRKASQEGADDTPKKQLETQTKILTKMEKMADQFANAALKAFMG